jgi:hypothetical protein
VLHDAVNAPPFLKTLDLTLSSRICKTALGKRNPRVAQPPFRCRNEGLLPDILIWLSHLGHDAVPKSVAT